MVSFDADRKGETSLYCASFHSHARAGSLLLSAGATGKVFWGGFGCPLTVAIGNDRDVAVVVLLSEGLEAIGGRDILLSPVPVTTRWNMSGRRACSKHW